jgi:haloalkane dehalogenase|tara:strand:- start:6550 stop:7437 length:888 start_codon:yes stop_codon:yes gene_type:complete
MNNKNSAKFNYKKKFLEIHGKKMAYIDEGQGDPTVFLHGNPTSSYLWRNIIPYAEEVGRVIAPDLIGMGDSEKLDDSGPDKYTFLEHSKFLYKLLDELDLDNVSLVIHDWGSALGFNWAKINPSKIKSITYMEAIVCPIDSWEEWPEIARKTFQLFRSDAGEELILEKNYFVERVLSGDTRLEMDSEEMQTYLKPFFNPGEDRRPTLTWPRQIPIAGEPREVVKIVQEYEEFLGNSDIPKLFVNAEPGSILVGKQRERARLWPNQKEVTVKGGHFIQEISPNEIGKYLKEFLLSI